jgi:tetratricopeptide (TPR) repeat protein
MDDISKMDKRISSKKKESTNSTTQPKSRKLPPVRGEKPTNSTTDGMSKQSKPSPSAKEMAANKDDAKSRKIKTLAPMDMLVGETPAGEKKELGFAESIGGYDFRAWEKYDVEKAMEEIDSNDQLSEQEKKDKLANARDSQKQREALRKKRLERDRENLSSDFLEALDGMSKEEREFIATRERQKGNECFKAGELDEAIVNYTRSAALNPFNAPVHANRSLAFLRLKMFERAEDDCTHALEVDPKYTKAWSRRGMVRHRRGKYADAISDFELALKLEPTNVEVSKLLSKSKAKFEELEGVDRKAGTSFTRVKIEEVDSDSDEDDTKDKGNDESEAQGFRKIAIVEEDDSDSDEDGNEDEDDASTSAGNFTKVQIECDDDESDDSRGCEGEKEYTTVAIVDVDDDDESDDDDDDSTAKEVRNLHCNAHVYAIL